MVALNNCSDSAKATLKIIGGVILLGVSSFMAGKAGSIIGDGIVGALVIAADTKNNDEIPIEPDEVTEA